MSDIPKMTTEPRFIHDCEACIYLGQHHKYDLYLCPNERHPTVIGRFGNEGPDYGSGLPFVGIAPYLTEAARIAVERKLLDPDRKTGSSNGWTVAEGIQRMDDQMRRHFEPILDACYGVMLLLRTALKDYADEPWAVRCVAAITAFEDNR